MNHQLRHVFTSITTLLIVSLQNIVALRHDTMEVTGLKEATASAPPTSLPPEKPAAVWTRRVIIAAFWAVVCFLGLPHWTWTTSIHRSSLPLESMNAWADGQVCS